MRNSLLTQSVLAACLLAAAPLARAQATATFHAIGDLPGGTTYSQVRDVTRVGGAIVAVGGGSANAGSTGMDTPVVWTVADGLVAIPNLAVNTQATNPSFASAITPDGAYLASRTRIATTGGVRHAAVVTRAGLTTVDLGTLAGFPNFSAANAISDDGSVLYGFGIHDAQNHNQAIRFTSTPSVTATAIPFLSVFDDASSPAGRGASADGNIMVGTSTNTSVAGTNAIGIGNAAFRYVNGTGVSAIPLLSGGSWSVALGLTRDGNVALVVGNSHSAPQGEAYLYDFTAAKATRLGTPNGSRSPNNLGGVSEDGVVALTWWPADSQSGFATIHNANGWHDLEDLAERAGVDLDGWKLDAVLGISPDGTLVWGSGNHNGVTEGWVLDFPAGYLASAAEPAIADSPNSPIVGTWTAGDPSLPGSAVLVLFEDGYFLHMQVAADEDMPHGTHGFERGRFRWDQTTGNIRFKTLLDTNGDIGLSGALGAEDWTATVSGNTLTVNIPTETPVQLTRVGGPGLPPIVGTFGSVASGISGSAYTFLPNGIYYQASYEAAGANSMPPDGIERGTYTWDAVTGAFTAGAIVDVNDSAGLSNLAPQPATVTFPGDGRVLYLNGNPTARRAVAGAVLYGIGDLPGSVVSSEVRDVTKVDGRIIAVGGSAANAGSLGSDTGVAWSPNRGLVALPNIAVNTTATNPVFVSAITPDAAWIAGRSRPAPTGGVRHAVRISLDSMDRLDLGFLAGFPGFSAANAISDNGEVMYGFAVANAQGRNQAVRFTATGPTITAIPFLNANDDTSIPAGRGTSADGNVMVGTSTNTTIDGIDSYGPGNAAFRYVQGTGVSAIPQLPGGSWSIALGLTKDGAKALVVGNSNSAPQGEAYVYDFGLGQAFRFGTPNGSWRANSLGGISGDGKVIAITWYDANSDQNLPGIANANGWHDLADLATRAGADLTGWQLKSITGMSPNATLVWGMGFHNGNNEGWVLEFPGGFLNNAVEPLPLAVTTPLVGAWTTSDVTANGAVLVFFGDGRYLHLQVPAEDEMQWATAGFERGTYAWDQGTGAISFKTLLDTNGDIGLSGANGSGAFTAVVTGDTLTVTTPPEDGSDTPEVHVLYRVVPTRAIEGLFTSGNTANDTTAAVFLPNGVYFLAQDGNSDASTGGDPNGFDGLERGTYTWNGATGVFTATPNVDNNGEWGLSHPDHDVTVVTFSDDQNTIIFDGEPAASRVTPLSQPFPPEQPPGPDVPTRPSFFDAAGYLANNGDIAAAIGNAADKLDQAWRHYYLYGISEGRTDGDFNVQAYLAKYPDLAAIYGSNLQGAAMHWYTIGRSAGLRIPAGFDVNGYFARNQDIAGAFANDKYGAWLHYYNYGVYEGRSFDANFIAAEYLELNLDLKAAIGPGNLKEAVMHWLTWGHPMEDRMGRVPIGFNVDSYLARYPDLAAGFASVTPVAVRNVAVWNHYIAYGTLEGRSDGDFEAYNYLATNPDLAAVFGSDIRGAALHWYFYGRREGRRIPGGFDVRNYRALYPDLVVFAGDDLYGCWIHYRDVGVLEGRIYDNLFRPAEYLALNPDIAAVVGNNYRDALLHWLYYGQFEGRPGRY